MRKILVSSLICFTAASVSQAEESTASSYKPKTNETFSVSYMSQSFDFTQGSSKASGDLSGYAISGTLPVSEKFFVGASFSSSDGTILGINASVDQKSLGVGINLLDDLDLANGTGSRLRLGVAKVTTDFTVSLGGSSSTDKDSENFITSDFELATGDKSSFNVGISGPTKDFNPTFLIGGRFEVGPGSISAGYSFSEDIVDGVTIEARGFSLGYSYSY